MQNFENGCLKRVSRDTNLNKKSSRSHCIINIQLTQRKNIKNTLNSLECFDKNVIDEEGYETITSILQIVDLAGSEKNKKSKATGIAFKEAININTGLFNLCNVINILTDEKKKGTPYLYIPQRDSKLTRILENSLGLNSYGLMIACINPSF